MKAVMTNWVSVGLLSDIPRRGARRVQKGVLTIAVFRTAEDRIFALEDKCPHKGGPLSQGIIHGDCVSCPLHNWVISLSTGNAQGVDEGATMPIPVKLDGDVIYLDLNFQASLSKSA